MNITDNKERGAYMKNINKCFGNAALTFGAGVLLCAFLPPVVLVCAEAIIIIAAGAIIFCHR